MAAVSPDVDRARAPIPVAVLASGGGSNLQALIDHFNAADSSVARVALVVSDRADAGALERAARAGIPATVVAVRGREADDVARDLLALFDTHRIGLVVLAGYLKLIPAAVVRRYAGRIVNVHPALLPAFGGPGMYGMRVHRAVIEAGAAESGPTVHLVDEEYDRGAVLARCPVPVLPGDSPESLAARVLQAEHALLPVVVEALALGLAPQRPITITGQPGTTDWPGVADVRRALGLTHREQEQQRS